MNSHVDVDDNHKFKRAIYDLFKLLVSGVFFVIYLIFLYILFTFGCRGSL